MKTLFLTLLLALPIFAAADPGAAGPFAVTREEYNFGDAAAPITSFSFPVEMRASVHYPTGLSAGPYPIVVLLHGRHAPCYTTENVAIQAWPCPEGSSAIPSFQGFDYIASNLASWGYIVVSVSANGIAAVDNVTGDFGIDARAELVQDHLDLWRTFQTTGAAPFGSKFVGKVNLNRVATMGHSRGGEGVAKQYLLNQSLGSPYGIQAVFAIAPVSFYRPVVNNTPIAVTLPYCDGDVSNLEGIHLYDDARYNVAGDPTPKYSILLMGGNHNYFNTVWTPGLFPAGTADDWTYVSGGGGDSHCSTTQSSNGRLTDAQQRAAALAYVNGFIRMHIGGEDFAAYFSGDQTRPGSIGSASVFVSYQAPDTPAARRDINRLRISPNLNMNALGGNAGQVGISPYTLCGGNYPQPRLCLPNIAEAQQPHSTQSIYNQLPRGPGQLQTGWTANTAKLMNDIPVGQRNFSNYSAIVFRVGVNWGSPTVQPGLAADFKVTLTDGSGATHSANVSAYSNALFFPLGNVFPLPKLLLNTVRIPFSAFPNANLRDIRQIAFQFDQRSSGAVLLADIAAVK